MKQPIVVVDVGQMGSVLARGFLRLGHPVYPVTRTISMAATAEELPHPELVLVAVAEGEQHGLDLPALHELRRALV